MLDSSLSFADVDTPAADVDARALARVEEVVRTLGKTVRAYQLYEGNSPSYDRFVDLLRVAFLGLWQEVPALTLDVQEGRLLWEGHKVFEAQQRSEDISFLFHRDGIRQLTLRPGFEQSELPVFLALLARVHRIREDQDDLITLLWAQDFAHLDYRHIDVAVEGMEIPGREGEMLPGIDAAAVREEVQLLREERMAPGRDSGAGDLSHDLPVAFQETLHFLEESELRLIKDELRRELDRDLMRDVLHGLFDRMQDGDTARQLRIIHILTDLLPALISGGRIRQGTLILQELATIATREPPLPAAVLHEVRSVFLQLAEPGTVREMVRTVEDAPEAIHAEDFGALLSYFPPEALAPLIGAAEAAERGEVRRTLGRVVEQLARAEPNHLVSLLGSQDPLVAAGAARLVGKLAIAGAAARVAPLLERPEAAVRLAAVSALQELRVASAAGALEQVLEDPEREVRIAAARALGSVRYTPARGRLETLIQSRQVREADITERIAFFESFGSVAGAQGIELLDRMLNSRSWIGRREPPEIRACAALALGRIDDPRAKQALVSAAQDPEAVVRNAVARSIKRERP
jgi:hypothetical protein